MWIKCLLQAVEEIYTAVKYGLMFYPCADLRVVPTIPCCPCAPSWRCVQGAGLWSWVGERKAPLQRSRKAGVEKRN